MTKTTTKPPISDEEQARLLALFQAAVAAKVAYWDALAAFERAFCNGGELSDASTDKLGETLENLAAGLNEPADACTMVTLDCMTEWTSTAAMAD